MTIEIEPVRISHHEGTPHRPRCQLRHDVASLNKCVPMRGLVCYAVLLAGVFACVCRAEGPATAAMTPATQPATRQNGAAIPPGEFASLIGKPNYILLDVRTPEEYAAGHLHGAVLIDFGAPEFQQRIKQLSRDKTYLVYCRSGYRSKLACEQMQQLGFTSLVGLKGGTRAWESAGQPVEASQP